MLSTKTGTPIAKVVGNPDYDLILVVMEEMNRPKALKKDAKVSLAEFVKLRKEKKSSAKPNAINTLMEAKHKKLASSSDDDSSESEPEYSIKSKRGIKFNTFDLASDDDIFNVLEEDDIYHRTKSYRKIDKKDIPADLLKASKEKLSFQISFFEGFMTPVPNIDKERDVLYIAGPSGSGKSTYTRRYLINYLKMYPENKIYIFSCVASDEAFNDLPNVQRIPLDESLSGINMDHLTDSCCVFDDIDVIASEKVRKILQNLRDQTLEIGRHNRITVCATSHQLTNYKTTRVLLNEATAVTVFPKQGSGYHIKRYLKEYVGLETKAVQRLFDLPSRWITISRIAPMFVLHEKGVIMMNSL